MIKSKLMRKKALVFSMVLTLIYTSCKTSKQVYSSSSVNGAEHIVEASPVAENAPKPFDYFQQSSMLLGYFDPAGLKREPHSAWYYKGFDEYMPSSDALNSLIEISKEGLSIKIVMGTWCPDSRREVPRFMKILNLWQFPAEKVTFIGVDVNKQSPVAEYAGLMIERVPTFIIYKNNIEAGRIIEVPKTSLEQDIVNILQGMK
jgi:thiol-disulfide isomerase/thioredoxin